MFNLACRYTYQAVQAAAVIMVLAVLANSHHTSADQTRFAQLIALSEVAPIREPMALRQGTDRARLSKLLAEAEQEASTTRR